MINYTTFTIGECTKILLSSWMGRFLGKLIKNQNFIFLLTENKYIYWVKPAAGVRVSHCEEKECYFCNFHTGFGDIGQNTPPPTIWSQLGNLVEYTRNIVQVAFEVGKIASQLYKAAIVSFSTFSLGWWDFLKSQRRGLTIFI